MVFWAWAINSRSLFPCFPAPLCPAFRTSVTCGRNERVSGTNPHPLVAVTTLSCKATSSRVTTTPAIRTPVRSKQPNSPTCKCIGAPRTLTSRAFRHSICSVVALPRNCSVMCHDSGSAQRNLSDMCHSPSCLLRSRFTTAASSDRSRNRQRNPNEQPHTGIV